MAMILLLLGVLGQCEEYYGDISIQGIHCSQCKIASFQSLGTENNVGDISILFATRNNF